MPFGRNGIIAETYSSHPYRRMPLQRLALFYIPLEHAFPVGHFPGSVKYQPGAFGQQLIINFIWSVGGPVIIFMQSAEIKYNGHSFLCKIVMVASVKDPL